MTLLKFYIKPSDVHRHNAYLDFVFVTVILTFDIYWHLIVHHSILFEMDLLIGYKTPSIVYKCNFRKGALHEPDHHLYFVNSISTQKYLQKSGIHVLISINFLHSMFQVIKVKKKRSMNMAQAHNSTFLSWQEFFPWLYMPYLHEAACLWKFSEQFKMRQCKVCNYQSWQKEDNMTAVFVYHRKTNRKYQNTPGVDLGGVGWVGWSAGPPYLTPSSPHPHPRN